MSPVNQYQQRQQLRGEERYGEFSKLEVLRLVTQCLDDMEYTEVSKQLKTVHAGNSDDQHVQTFLQHIRDGQFEDAESLVSGLKLCVMQNTGDIETSEDYGALKIKYMIRRQHFLETLLVEKDQGRAINFLRSHFHRLKVSEGQIRMLSSLVLDSEDGAAQGALEKLGWHGSAAESRAQLCTAIAAFVSADSLLPPHRLRTLLEQAVEYQRSKVLIDLRDNPADVAAGPDQEAPVVPLFKDLAFDRSRFPTRCIHELSHHENEVWFVKFSNRGRYLCSTSKDSKILIYDVEDGFRIKHRLTESQKPVSYASWSPDDRYLLSCGMDLHFRLWDVETGKQLQMIKFFETVRVWTFGWLPDSSGFITASPDKKLVWFKLGKNDCKMVYSWDLSQRIADLAVTKDGKKLLTITHNNSLEVYDLESKLKIGFANIGKRLTSISTSQDSRHCIINVAPEEIQLWDVEEMRLVSIYIGQQQHNYVIRSSFGNWDESVILSGSEDGRIYIWNRQYGELIFALEAHKGLVNGVDWNLNGRGEFGKMFASAGDDHVVKIWGL